MGTCLLLPAILSFCAFATSRLSAQTAPVSGQTLLGQGHGVDHVAVGVRDMAQAQHDYEQLGFKLAIRAHTPDGVFDNHIYLDNGTYVELAAVSGNTPAKQSLAAVVADFLKKHEGAMFLGINVSSAKDAADYLKARNFDAVGPIPGSMMREGETTLPPPMWYSVFGNDTPAAGKNGIILPIFFIQYVSYSQRIEQYRAAGYMDHPNTARAIHAVWFAVHDLQAQLATLRAVGLESGDAREAKFIGADGRDVNAGKGVLLILEPSDKSGALAKYLSDHTNWIDRWPHDEGIIGLSIQVANLDKARQLAEAGTGRKLETYKGSYGTSFLLPPEVTHGVWIEMFQFERP
jgi:catechol 2,3-dioxygenase-like lactoylglutathione lyase family enzyme